MPFDPDPFHSNLIRGSMLLNQGRPRDALPYIQAAIAANPDSPRGYADLATCWNGIPAQRHKALQAIDRAISLAPTDSSSFGRKGWFLICQGRHRAAFHAAQAGLALNPNCPYSLNSLANAHTKLNQWKKAEAACLRILKHNPNDAPGLNLLAQALRHLGRWKESNETTARLLAQQPDNAFGHANAGYGALAAGDHLRANEHFLQSLRMDPHSDHARRGLLQSLRARIWIIRFNTRIATALRRPSTPLNLFTSLLAIIFIIAGCAFTSIFLDKLYPMSGAVFFSCLFSLLPLYIYLSVLVGILGNFLLLLDPLGRHALTTHEKIKACLSGIAFFALIFLLLNAHAWLIALGLLIFFALLVLTIQYPLLKDRWQRRRAAKTGNS